VLVAVAWGWHEQQLETATSGGVTATVHPTAGCKAAKEQTPGSPSPGIAPAAWQ